MIINKESSTRVLWLDMLRIIATFAVIFLHVSSTALYSNTIDYEWGVSVMFDSLVRWAVPIFVMISGALFLRPEKDLGIRTILQKYVPRLLMAYAFWWVFYSLMRAGYDTMQNGAFAFRMGYFVPHFHLWFLPMLAGVYLLIPFLRVIAANKRLMRYGLILWLCYMFFGFKMMPEIPQFSQLFVMNMLMGFSGYFLLGYYLSTSVINTKLVLGVYALGLLGFAVTAGGTIITNKLYGGGNLDFLTTLTPWVAVMAVAIFVAVKNNEAKYGIKIQILVNYVRKDLFGIYLTHGIWLMLLNVPAVRSLCNLVVMIPLLTLVVFILSLYTTKLLRSIPLVQKVVE